MYYLLRPTWTECLFAIIDNEILLKPGGTRWWEKTKPLVLFIALVPRRVTVSGADITVLWNCFVTSIGRAAVSFASRSLRASTTYDCLAIVIVASPCFHVSDFSFFSRVLFCFSPVWWLFSTSRFCTLFVFHCKFRFSLCSFSSRLLWLAADSKKRSESRAIEFKAYTPTRFHGYRRLTHSHASSTVSFYKYHVNVMRLRLTCFTPTSSETRRAFTYKLPNNTPRFPFCKTRGFQTSLVFERFFFSHFYYFTFVHFTVDNNFARTKLIDFQMSLEKSIKVCLKFNVDFVCLFWLGVTSQLIKIHQFRTLMFIWNSSLRNDSCMTAIDSNYLSSVVAGSILFFVRFFFLSCFIVGVIFLIRLMRVWRDGKVKWPFVISEVALSVEPDCKVQ